MMPEQPIIAFENAAAFRRWLKANHAAHGGIWMQIAKKASGIPSITYLAALDEALCYGWIDGQKKSHDATSWLQKFTKRGTRSVWSKINVGHVARLTSEGRMQPSGQAAVDAAKADGRWDAAYSSASTAEMPADFLDALTKHAEAKAFFDTLSKTNRYSIFYHVTTAKKPETRARRVEKFVGMMKRGEKLR